MESTPFPHVAVSGFTHQLSSGLSGRFSFSFFPVLDFVSISRLLSFIPSRLVLLLLSWFFTFLLMPFFPSSAFSFPHIVISFVRLNFLQYKVQSFNLYFSPLSPFLFLFPLPFPFPFSFFLFLLLFLLPFLLLFLLLLLVLLLPPLPILLILPHLLFPFFLISTYSIFLHPFPFLSL